MPIDNYALSEAEEKKLVAALSYVLSQRETVLPPSEMRSIIISAIPDALAHLKAENPAWLYGQEALTGFVRGFLTEAKCRELLAVCEKRSETPVNHYSIPHLL